MDKKVLLVADDDEMNRMIIRKFLKNDFDVIEAENGREAMDILHTKCVDGMLLDIIMPEMDGLEVLEAVKKEHDLSNIGILVATSMKEKTERKALALGADDIVSKPYDPVVIKQRLNNILAVKEMRLSVNRVIEYVEAIKKNISNQKVVEKNLNNILCETKKAFNINEEGQR